MAKLGRDLDQGARRVLFVVLAVAASVALSSFPAGAEESDFTESLEIEAPIELVWQVLTDFQAWPRFMPALDRVEVEERRAETVAIHHETRQLGIDVRFTTLTRVDPSAFRLVSTLDPEGDHDIRSMRSAWEVTRLSEGRVRVELRSALDSGQPVPGFVERRMVRQSVADTLRGLADEVDRRAMPAFAQGTEDAPSA